MAANNITSTAKQRIAKALTRSRKRRDGATWAPRRKLRLAFGNPSRRKRQTPHAIKPRGLRTWAPAARVHHVNPATQRPIEAPRLFQDDPRRRHLQCNALQRSLQARNKHHLLLGGGTKATRLRTQGTLHSKGAAPRRRTVRRLRNRALLAQRPRNPSTYTQQRQRHRQTPRRTRGPTHPTRTLQVSRRRRC